MRKLDPDTSDCTEKDLTPTQCTPHVVPLGVREGAAQPLPRWESRPEPFANSVLQLIEQDAGGPGGATGSPESGVQGPSARYGFSARVAAAS